MSEQDVRWSVFGVVVGIALAIYGALGAIAFDKRCNQTPAMIHAKTVVVSGWANDGGPVNCQLVITDKSGQRYQIMATDTQLLDAIDSQVQQIKHWMQSRQALTQKGR